jgi:hypothetical protein
LRDSEIRGIEDVSLGVVAKVLELLKYRVAKVPVALNQNLGHVFDEDDFGSEVLYILEEAPIEMISRIVDILTVLVSEGPVTGESLTRRTSREAINIIWANA